MYRFIFAALLIMFSFLNKAQNLDPTQPLVLPNTVGIEEVKKDLTLETIIHSDKNKSAIISGKLMKLGDFIGAHELIAVNASNVILRSDGERLKLSMFSNVITK